MNAPIDVSFFARAAKPITSYRKYWAQRFGTAQPAQRLEYKGLHTGAQIGRHGGERRRGRCAFAHRDQNGSGSLKLPPERDGRFCVHAGTDLGMGIGKGFSYRTRTPGVRKRL